MNNFYETLGLLRSANEQEVKAAYRALAKQFHPDVNPREESAERRFKEISLAYQTLGDHAERAAYDHFLARWRAQARRRHRRLAAIAAASAMLSAGTVTPALLWIQHLHAHRTVIAQATGKEMGHEATPLSQVEGVRPQGSMKERRPEGAAVGISSRKASNWTLYRSSRFGFAVRYPADVFASEGENDDDNVHTLVSLDGQAVLRIFAAENVAGATLTRYRRLLIAQRYTSATINYAPQHQFWFALSGIRGDKTFYERVTFSCNGRSIHGWQMTYPATERRFYDRIVEKVHRSYKYSNGPRAHCAEARSNTSRPGKV
jgi:curved DNA-binding protein CbpA